MAGLPLRSGDGLRSGVRRRDRPAIAPIAKYRDDKYLLGYFTDNELPWVNDALDRHLTLLAHDEDAYIAVRKWYDERKGVKDAPAGEITDADRKAFQAFYF